MEMEKQNNRLLMQVAISLRYMPNGECLHFRYDKLAIRCEGTCMAQERSVVHRRPDSRLF